MEGPEATGLRILDPGIEGKGIAPGEKRREAFLQCMVPGAPGLQVLAEVARGATVPSLKELPMELRRVMTALVPTPEEVVEIGSDAPPAWPSRGRSGWDVGVEVLANGLSAHAQSAGNLLNRDSWTPAVPHRLPAGLLERRRASGSG